MLATIEVMKEESGVGIESEQVTKLSEEVVPAKKKSPLFIAGIVAGALVLFALGIVIFGRKDVAQPTASGNSDSGQVADNVYQNKEYFYQLTLPPKWSAVSVNASDQGTVMFTTSGDAMMSVTATRQQGSLEAFLGLSDEEAETNVEKTMPVKVGGYDGVERVENWSDQGVRVIGTYVKVQDMIYSFVLLPTGNKNAVTNETLLRQYRQLLASFRLTDPSALGKDWVDYAHANWLIQYPQNWKIIEKEDEVKLYRDNYELVITQTTVPPSVCQFSDSPLTTGYAGDLRDKQFQEVTTKEGLTLRRYFKGNAGDKSNLYFCGKLEQEEQFRSPTIYGAIAYSVPAKFDEDILHEMDEIVKTLHGSKTTKITEAELARGWYWGDENQQKDGTPGEWSWQESGRNSCWHAPSVLCEE